MDAILGGNAVGCHGLDAEALHKVAQRINAPTVSRVNQPLEEIPADHGMWAFRMAGTFG